MLELTADDFRDVCRTDRMRSEISAIEAKRRKALLRFWLILAATPFAAFLVLLVITGFGQFGLGMVFAAWTLGAGYMLARRPLSTAGESLKHPLLEALAEEAGLEYLPDGFDPPGMAAAAKTLFGNVAAFRFTDLLHGTDESGRRFAMYEAKLRGAGRGRRTYFSGQIYAWQRGGSDRAETAVLADGGFLDFIAPSGMDRLTFGGDPEFNRVYEIYGTDPDAAHALLQREVRKQLLGLCRDGPATAYFGPEDALVAVWCRDLYEPGSMFRGRSGEERAKGMFEDLCASLALMRRLKALIG